MKDQLRNSALLVVLVLTLSSCAGSPKAHSDDVIEFRQVLSVESAKNTNITFDGHNYGALSCNNLPKPSTSNVDLIACDSAQEMLYFLGPVELDGNTIQSASVTGDQSSYFVEISFDSTGKELFKQITSRITVQESPKNQLAVTSGTVVITAPSINEAIPSGTAQISGNFSHREAQQLADAIDQRMPLPVQILTR